MHLQKGIIHDMETVFGTCWSVKKIKKNPPELRNERRLLDVTVNVWKELVKAYDKVDARRKSDEESTEAFEFFTKIISKSLNAFYTLLVHY